MSSTAGQHSDRLRFLPRLSRMRDKLVRRAVEGGGVPAAWTGYRWIRRERVREFFLRTEGVAEPRGRFEIIHRAGVASNPLPRNVTDAIMLPDDPGWWGYSFRDVPQRQSGETFLATVRDCRVLPHLDRSNDQFYVAIVNSNDHLLSLREIGWRAGHASMIRSSTARYLERATWVTERVFHNHSHWLTAHLPKLLLLRERGELAHVMLPEQRPAAVDDSLRLLGFEPDAFDTFANDVRLDVGELTVLDTDRFRPELLRSVREALGARTTEPHRRVFISRAGAARRRLVNEEDVWRVLRRAGFERVRMELLPFVDQVALMAEAAVLVAPHGAGLTNMLFCAPGTHVVEFADMSFPNPNFYAMAAALDLPYWLLAASPVGAGHPLERDMEVDMATVSQLVAQLGAEEDALT